MSKKKMPKTKKQFLERWNEYVNDFILITNSTEKHNVYERVKRIREDMRRIVYEIADEKFNEDIE